jgi:hypothetical protein
MSTILAQLTSRPDLQGILAQLQQSQASAGAANPAASLNPDMARYLAGAVAQQQQQLQQQQPPQNYNQPPPQNLQQANDLVALLGGYAAGNQTNHGMQPAGQPNVTHGNGAQPTQPDMQQLMAQLANYGGSR